MISVYTETFSLKVLEQPIRNIYSAYRIGQRAGKFKKSKTPQAEESSVKMMIKNIHFTCYNMWS